MKKTSKNFLSIIVLLTYLLCLPCLGATDHTSPNSGEHLSSNLLKKNNLFTQVKKLTASDGAEYDQFGFSVSINGDTVVVGVVGDDYHKGSAYIFDRDQGGADNWGQVKKITASDGATGDEFGGSVSIDSDTLVVGARYDDANLLDSGSAYIFDRNQGGLNNWGQVKKIIASDSGAVDYFGESVSINGDTVVVGAINTAPCSAYIFDRNQGGLNNWGQVKKITALDGTIADYFGESVSINGDTIVVGAYGDDDNGFWSGSAYIFYRDQGGTDNWGGVQKIAALDGTSDDFFGRSVSINGVTIVVGAYGDDDNGDSSGSAYIFDRNQGGADNWGQVKKIIASGGAVDDFFGMFVSINGDTVVVGAIGDDDNGDESGSAYIFDRNQGGTDNWGQVKKIIASDGAGFDAFGRSVSINGDTIVVGAYGDDSAYIFSSFKEEFPWIIFYPAFIKKK